MSNTWRYTGNEFKYVKEVLESGFGAATSGSFNKRFEDAFAERLGMKYAITLNSGTSTLHSALAAFDVGEGDEVIIPALTVVMCGLAVVLCNAKPVFADVDPNTFLMDPKDIEKKITPKTKAIMAVHMYGQNCDMDAIMYIAKRYNLKVVEDCAESLFATDDKGRLSGCVGDAGSFSFENSKHLAVGDGGMLVTNDEMLAERMRKFAGMGFKNIKASTGQVRKNKDIFQNPSYLRHDSIGLNYRLTEVAAAVGLGQLEHIDEVVEWRNAMGKRFLEVIADEQCEWLVPQYVPDGYTNTYWTFAARFDGKEKKGIEWEDFRKKFMEFGGDGIYSAWALVYNEPSMQLLSNEGKYFPDGEVVAPGMKGFCNEVDCPEAEALQLKMMQFTTNQHTEEEIELQASALQKTLRYFA